MATVFTDAGEAKTVTQMALVTWKLAQGTGTNAAAVTDTTLQTESAETRVTGTETSPSNGVMQLVGTVTATGTRAITEAGVFDAASSGNMIARSVFSAINVVSGDSITFTWQITYTGS